MTVVHEPSIGELADAVADLTAKLNELRESTARLYLRNDVYDANRLADRERAIAHEERVLAVEDKSTWLGRAVFTALLLPILVGVIVGILLAFVIR